jgi:hypothetical protein
MEADQIIVDAASDVPSDQIYLLGRCVHRAAVGEIANEPERDAVVMDVVETVLEDLNDSSLESALNSTENLHQRPEIPRHTNGCL